MRVQPLGQEDPLEEEMATHSRILAWRIPWTEQPGGLVSMHPSPRSTRFLWGFALYRHPSSPLEKDIPPLSSSLQTFCLRLSLRLFMKQAAGNCCNALSWS